MDADNGRHGAFDQGWNRHPVEGGEEISRPLPLPWDATVDVSARQPSCEMAIVFDGQTIAQGRESVTTQNILQAGTHYLGIRWLGGDDLPNPVVEVRASRRQIAATEVALAPVKTPEATEYGHLFAIQQDLKFAIRALDRLLPLIPDNSEDASLLAEALWASALITYTRCFSSGRRTALRLIDLGLSPEMGQLHERLDVIRDKHIAHPVGDLEQIIVTSGRAPDGKVHLLTLVDRHIAGTPEQVSEFHRLAEAVLQRVQEQMEGLGARITRGLE